MDGTRPTSNPPSGTIADHKTAHWVLGVKGHSCSTTCSRYTSGSCNDQSRDLMEEVHSKGKFKQILKKLDRFDEDNADYTIKEYDDAGSEYSENDGIDKNVAPYALLLQDSDEDDIFVYVRDASGSDKPRCSTKDDQVERVCACID